ncbi:MAG: phage holin family protein [Candidatus Peribacteria bacterium]|jgi:hypothetical protein|nr:phage holin family protein [Candidatus Peribacteria bacterium]
MKVLKIEQRKKSSSTQRDELLKEELVKEWKRFVDADRFGTGIVAGLCIFVLELMVWFFMSIGGGQPDISGWWACFILLLISFLGGLVAWAASKTDQKEPEKKDIELLVKNKLARMHQIPDKSVYEIAKSTAELTRLLKKWDDLPDEQEIPPCF